MEGALTHLPQMLLLSYFISSNSNQAFFFLFSSPAEHTCIKV